MGKEEKPTNWQNPEQNQIPKQTLLPTPQINLPPSNLTHSTNSADPMPVPQMTGDNKLQNIAIISACGKKVVISKKLKKKMPEFARKPWIKAII